MSPQQIDQLAASDQATFNTVLKVLEARKDRALRRRDLDLRERVFEAQYNFDTKAAQRHQQALDNLQNFTAANIDQASAKDIATINKGSLSSLINLNATIQRGKRPSAKKHPTARIQEYMFAEQQRKELGLNNIMETPYAQLLMRTKKGEKNLREQVTLKAQKDLGYRWTKMSTPEKRKYVDEQVSIIQGTPEGQPSATEGEITTPGDAIMQKALEKFKLEKRSRLIDKLFIVPHRTKEK